MMSATAAVARARMTATFMVVVFWSAEEETEEIRGAIAVALSLYGLRGLCRGTSWMWGNEGAKTAFSSFARSGRNIPVV